MGAAVAAFLFGQAGTPHAQDPDLQHQQNRFKVGLLLHFLQLVQPAQERPAGAPLVLGIVGKDPFGGWLDQVTRYKVKGRPVVLRRFSEAKNLEPCDLLFISLKPSAALTEALAHASRHGSLTVGEGAHFIEQGGIIGLLSVPDDTGLGMRVRFEVNLAAARRNGLGIGSEVLELAVRILQ